MTIYENQPKYMKLYLAIFRTYVIYETYDPGTPDIIYNKI